MKSFKSIGTVAAATSKMKIDSSRAGQRVSSTQVVFVYQVSPQYAHLLLKLVDICKQ